MADSIQYDDVNGEPVRLTFTVTEAARILGISRAKAYECARTGELPVVRFGRRLVVPAAALARLLGAPPGPPAA